MTEGGELKAFMVLLFVLSAFVMSIGVFVDDIEASHGLAGLNQSIPDGTTYYGNASGTAAGIQEDIGTDIVGSEGQDNLLTAAWKMLKKAYNGISIMTNIINDLIEVLPVPEELEGVAGAFIGILTVIIIFGIIGVVTRTRAP